MPAQETTIGRRMKIAVDAMGGDHAPDVNVDGAIAAVREFDVSTILVGDSARLEALIERRGVSDREHFEIVHAPEVIEMDEPATAAIRRKKGSSIRVAALLVREGRADGLVSAGHTGAAMVSAKMVIGTIEGVDRPALAAVIPTRTGFCLLLDVGANPECKNQHFREFAVMGHLYAQLLFHKRAPTIGLMSIGEEDTKGTDRTKEAFKVLKETGLNFVGNVEGSDVFAGTCDVIVTDGFTGNVLLKASESLGEMIELSLREEITRSLKASLGFLLSRSAFRAFKARLDYSEYGGAPLLGVKKCCIIGHGRSSAKAIKNAIRVAGEFARERMPERIQESIAELHSREATLLAR